MMARPSLPIASFISFSNKHTLHKLPSLDAVREEAKLLSLWRTRGVPRIHVEQLNSVACAHKLPESVRGSLMIMHNFPRLFHYSGWCDPSVVPPDLIDDIILCLEKAAIIHKLCTLEDFVSLTFLQPSQGQADKQKMDIIIILNLAVCYLRWDINRLEDAILNVQYLVETYQKLDTMTTFALNAVLGEAVARTQQNDSLAQRYLESALDILPGKIVPITVRTLVFYARVLRRQRFKAEARDVEGKVADWFRQNPLQLVDVDVYYLLDVEGANNPILYKLGGPFWFADRVESMSQKSCATCHIQSLTLMMCARCSTLYYCSKDCQKADWPRHKSTCNTLNAIEPGGLAAQRTVDWLTWRTQNYHAHVGLHAFNIQRDEKRCTKLILVLYTRYTPEAAKKHNNPKYKFHVDHAGVFSVQDILSQWTNIFGQKETKEMKSIRDTLQKIGPVNMIFEIENNVGTDILFFTLMMGDGVEPHLSLKKLQKNLAFVDPYFKNWRRLIDPVNVPTALTFPNATLRDQENVL